MNVGAVAVLNIANGVAAPDNVAVAEDYILVCGALGFETDLHCPAPIAPQNAALGENVDVAFISVAVNALDGDRVIEGVDKRILQRYILAVD